MSNREYVVTLQNREDLENFYDDIETPGGSLYIPDRQVQVANRRPKSRNTHYFLSDEEAATLRNDPRVLSVELTAKELGLRPMPLYEQSSVYWNRGSSSSINSHRNWGLYRCTLNSNVANWGQYTSYNSFLQATQSVAGTINIPATGKNVDIIIVDGHMDPSHPEYAVNSDGTGGSRINQFNWYQYNSAVLGGFASAYGTDYLYTPYVDPADPDRTLDNDHGAHVAGTAAGNSQGWARDANIYNINPYSTNPNYMDILSLFDYIREFHSLKPINPAIGRPNPTVVNNSWGYVISANVVDITVVRHRNQIYSGPFTEADLTNYGMIVNNGTVSAQYRYTPLDADIEDCINDGIIIVGAAGNLYSKIDNSGGQDYDNYFRSNSFNYYYHRGTSPTASSTSLCVGAVSANADETKASFSNCGPRVDIYAPGANIFSSVNSTLNANTYDYRNQYKYLSKYAGTSMASPQVCGVIACLLEIYPNWNQSSVNDYIKNVAKLGKLTDTFGGYTDYYSLQGSTNRFLFYKSERTADGQILPKMLSGLRSTTGQVYPRPKIYSYGPQSTS